MADGPDDLILGPEMLERRGDVGVREQIEPGAAAAGHVDRVVGVEIDVGELQRRVESGD